MTWVADLTVTYEIENQAALVAIGITGYWDLCCRETCSRIDWGTLRPGERKTVTVYFKNTGTDPITGSFTLTDWDPPGAAAFISLEWDFGDTPLYPGRIRPVHFTLQVSPNTRDITNFRFTILVTGTQYVPPG